MTDPIKLQPGPELDGLVAEEVRGWTRAPGYGGTLYWDEGEQGPIPGGKFAPRFGGSFRPSTDMAAAWEVHQNMQERLFSVRQRYYRAIQEAVRKRLKMLDRPAWPDVFGLLTPGDICLAALAAVRARKGTA